MVFPAGRITAACFQEIHSGIAMLAVVGLASALLSGAKVVLGAEECPAQLETSRLTQSAQREEFGPEGQSSAFLFSFTDPVRAILSRSLEVVLYSVHWETTRA